MYENIQKPPFLFFQGLRCFVASETVIITGFEVGGVRNKDFCVVSGMSKSRFSPLTCTFFQYITKYKLKYQIRQFAINIQSIYLQSINTMYPSPYLMVDSTYLHNLCYHYLSNRYMPQKWLLIRVSAVLTVSDIIINQPKNCYIS